MRIEITNTLSKVWGTADELKALDEATSYPEEGAEHTQAYKSHYWDGKVHLLRKATKAEHWWIPTGVLPDVGDDVLAPFKLTNARRPPGESAEMIWQGKPLRDYQQRAIDNVLKDRGPWTGRGMLNLPIRSGKTMTAAGLIQQTGLRTLFIVPSEMLLHQTAASFHECIEEAPIGIFGGGSHDTDWITIATAQTLLANRRMAVKLLQECDLLFIDEAHHLEGEAWRSLALHSDAYYKVGLSATVFVSRQKANNKASIWLKACTGPIVDRVSMNYLIDRGYLMKPLVYFYPFRHDASDKRGKDWHWTQKELVANNLKRNSMIADLAGAAVEQGKSVLIDSGRRDQLKQLRMLLTKRGVAAEVINGDTPSYARRDIMARFAEGETMCIIGTVFGEGIDIPHLEVVINAEGQKSLGAAVQRMRNLTPSKGKTEALFIDIADIGNKHLAKHSKIRLDFYKGLRGFKVRVCERGEAGYDPLA